MITEIVLESGVEMPKQRVVYAYPYEEMEVGDSFVVPLKLGVLNCHLYLSPSPERVH